MELACADLIGDDDKVFIGIDRASRADVSLLRDLAGIRVRGQDENRIVSLWRSRPNVA